MIVTKQTSSLSGFGGSYEDMCQLMLWRGVAYLAEAQPPKEMWRDAKSYENIYGVLLTEGDQLKALEKHIIREGEDVTGAMHQCVMQHLAYIHQHSVAEWLETLKKYRKPKEFFKWTGDLDGRVKP